MKISCPLNEKDIRKLKAGDEISLSGTIYAARDSAHKRFIELIDRGEQLPFDIKDAVIYYVGPTPARPGQIIGSAGPTTSSRMDEYTIPLLEKGLKGMVGKGSRGEKVVGAIKKNKAVYFLAVGGAGALISQSIKKSEIIAFPELGAEAVMKLQVKNLPCFVAIDSNGESIFR